IWLLGQVLRDVAERAADLEHREAVPAPRAQVGEEPGQEVPAPRLLEGKVLRSAQGTLALHEHAHHARAVRGGIVPPGDREHASVAQVLEAVGGLFRHAPQDSSGDDRLTTSASPGRRAYAWRASGAADRGRLRPDGPSAGGRGAAGAPP